MSRHLQPLEDILKEILPELEEPILFQNMLQNSDGSYEWKLLQWSLTELVEKFGNKKLPFRIGNHNKRTVSYSDILVFIYYFNDFIDNFINSLIEFIS